jgi:acetyltransferase
MDRTELNKKLTKMFYPSSVAVVGASEVPVKWGNLILTSILGWEYKGKVFPVNPKKDQILGIKCYPSLTAIPESVDLAVLVIPAQHIPAAMRECVAKGIPAAVVVSAGFKEMGEEGARIEKEIVDIAVKGGLVFIGPNTMGIASAHSYLEALPTPTAPKPGGLAIISREAARDIRKALVKFVAITSVHWASVMRGNRVSRVMPALLTRMSSRCHFATTSSTVWSTAA